MERLSENAGVRVAKIGENPITERLRFPEEGSSALGKWIPKGEADG